MLNIFSSNKPTNKPTTRKVKQMDSKVITDVKDMVKDDQSKLHNKLEKMVLAHLYANAKSMPVAMSENIDINKYDVNVTFETPARQSKNETTYGHFNVGKSWKRKDGKEVKQIAVNPYALQKMSWDQINETINHETIHLLNNLMVIEDCKSSGYHNKKFQITAEATGNIVVEKPKKGANGYHSTELTKKGMKIQNKLKSIKFDPTELYKELPDKKERKVTKRIKLTCNSCETSVMLPVGRYRDMVVRLLNDGRSDQESYQIIKCEPCGTSWFEADILDGNREVTYEDMLKHGYKESIENVASNKS